jgi:hypothetical protein
MFTLLPSLYFVAVHYFRQWNTPYYYEHSTEEGQDKIESHTIPEDATSRTSIDNQSIDKHDRMLLQSLQLSTGHYHSSFARSHYDEEYGCIPTLTPDEDNHSNTKKQQKKQLARSSSLINTDRRKMYTGDLTESDITYLMNETEFTREQILLWHGDFLVS